MMDSVSLVTSPLTKLLNVKWVTVAILTGQDGLDAAETLVTKMSAYDSAEAVPDHLPEKSQNHATNLVSSLILVWSLSKTPMSLDSLLVDTIRLTSSTQMNFTISKIKSLKVSD